MVKKNKYPPAFFFTDNNRTHNIIGTIKSLPKGVCVVFRHYDNPERALLAYKVSRICKAQKRMMLISQDINLAKNLNCGFHLPEYLLSNIRALDLKSFSFVTASTHSLEAIKRASKLNVTAAFISPVFETLSHKNKKPLGPKKVLGLAQLSNLPLYGLGGIKQNNKTHLLSHKNIKGFGAIGIFLK